MMDKDIDDISRSAFPDGDVAFDAKYWGQMGAMIDQRKKKRGFIFWWGTGAAVILLIGGLFAYTSIDNKTTRIAASKQSVKASRLANSSTLKEKPSKQNNPTTSEYQKNNEGSNASNSNLKIEDASIQATQNTEKEEPIIKTEGSIIKKTEAVPAKQEPISIKKEAVVPVKDEFNPEAKKQLEELVPSSGSLAISTESAISEDEQTVSTTASDHNNQHLFTVLNPLISGPIPIDFRRFNLYEMPLDTHSLKTKTEFGDETQSGSKLKYFIEPIVGFNSSYKTVSREIQVDKSTFKLDYQPTREVQLGINLGAKYDNFFGAIGLHFNQVQSTINVNEATLTTQTEQSIAERTIIDRIDSILIRTPVIKVPSGSDFVFQSGAPQYNVDTTIATVYDTTNTNTDVENTANSALNYKLQYLYVPLQIGYEYPIKNFFIGAGLVLDLGILINNKGELFDAESNQIVDVTSSDLVNKTILAYHLQLAFGYFLKSNLSIVIRPNLRQQIINPFKNPNLPNTRIGGFVVLRYDF
jgi:hypothetical protein